VLHEACKHEYINADVGATLWLGRSLARLDRRMTECGGMWPLSNSPVLVITDNMIHDIVILILTNGCIRKTRIDNIVI
jgi:hypothetical protein